MKEIILTFDNLLRKGAWDMPHTKFYDVIKFESGKDPIITTTIEEAVHEILKTAKILAINPYLTRSEKNSIIQMLREVKYDENNDTPIDYSKLIIRDIKPINDIPIDYEEEWEEALAEAKKAELQKHKPLNYDWPMRLFLAKVYPVDPSRYGAAIGKKIEHDSNNKLTTCNPNLGDADAITSNGKKLHYEIKSSYSHENGNFRIAHIRDYQKYNYFIFCFIDRVDDFKPYFYLLDKSFICHNQDLHLCAMNNTVEANAFNVNYDKATQIKKEKAFYIFGQSNLLNGTSYKDLLDYFKLL